MNLDSLSFTLSQISYLVATLTKKNYKQVVGDLTKLVTLHGLEADRHLLQCLFSSVDFSESTNKISAPSTQNQVLLEQCSSLLNKPSLLTAVCYVTDNPLGNHKTLKFGPQFFQQLSKCLRLSAVQEVVFALALRHSSNPEVANLAQTHLRVTVPALVQSYIDTEGSTRQHEGGLHETTPEVLHLILSAVLKAPKDVGLTNDIHTFLNTLQRDFPKDLVPVVLAPLVYPEQCELAPEMSSEGPGLSGGMLETSLADVITEMGYGFTSSVEECRSSLMKLGGRDISYATVARVLSVMCRTHSNLEDSLSIQTPGSFNKGVDGRTTWNIEVFVQALKEVVPNFQWNNVVGELDHAEFIIKDRQGLCLLINALRQGLQTLGFHPDTFPIDQLYRRWTNVEGQFSLIQNILKYPDVFCFADYPCISVAVDVLKTPPEQDGKELANWRSLNLVELLLSLSECGLYNHVQELFKLPVHNCPDVLVLALLQISGPVTLLRQELLTNLIPIFLGNHSNSAIILHNAWHAQTINIKPIIMHAMAEWYGRADCDQTRLSRILDVAQDLKALSMLLNAQSTQSFPFIIDLACLASRREYLKLEKWLSDKIREHGEPFVLACIKFLHRRCPGLGKNEDTLTKVAPLPNESLATIILCLQNCMSSVTPECHEAIVQLVTNCALILKSRQQQPTAILRSRAVDGAFNPSVIAGQLYNHTGVDSIPGITNNLTNLNLGGPTSSAFNIQGGLGPLVPSPGSPSRILSGGPSNSPYSMMPIQHQGPVGTSSSLVLGVNQMGNISRMGPNPTIDKARLQEYNLFPEISPNVAKDIEDEANSYFQRIYNHPPHPTLSIDEVLDMLRRFQDSPSKREKEVFNCMLRNLFEEYKFFPQYPDKELHITAQLFGGIIERGIVTSYVTLGLALRCVLEALKKAEGSKMYYFGIAALDRFKNRLKDYHKYCEHVRAIAHFSDFPQHLQEYVEYGLQSMEPPNKPQGPVLPASLTAMLAPPNTPVTQVYKTNSTVASTAPSKSSTSASSRPSIANATNIDTLLVATEKEEKVISPPESIQDKTAFIFNNLSQLNLKIKCDEIRELASEEFWPWISQYLVMKRASIEFNFHALYSNFLDTLNVPEVNRMVTRETFRNIKVLLRSDKAIANFSDRSLLKNLGHWLGMLTLARNKPILQIDIDLKSLLVEAYHKGQQELLYVVPFVAKVLESCAKSKVFKPPNPWTMAIMNVLAELHQEPDLKLTLKFEIEVLCKNLDIDVSQLKPTMYLKDPERVRKIEYQLSQPIKKENITSSSQGSVQSVSLNDPELVNIIPGQATSSPVAHNTSTTPTSLSAPPEPRFGYGDIQIAGMAAFQTHTVVSPSILLFQTQPQLKPLVRTSIERAVQEWIAPVVDRSIKIALETCEQIIRKDFALDPDENRMRLAAHYMVRNLTAGMAMTTCRDQLLTAINTHLKQALLANLGNPTVQQKEMIEQAASVIAADNMELACAFVQKTAVEKAIIEIDKRLMNEYDLRKLARLDGRRYCDSIALSYQADRMPEQIRLKVGGISSSQMAVYEEFARNIPGFLPNERDISMMMQKQNVTPIETQPHPTTAFQIPQATLPSDDIALLFDKLSIEVEQFIQATNGQAQYSHINNSMHMLRECLMHTIRNRELTPPQAVVQKCVEMLQECLLQAVSDSDPVLLRFKEVIMRILKSIQDPRVYGQQWTNKLVTRFLTECREELRYNVDAVDTLIKAGLVNLPQYDLTLAQCMENGYNFVCVSFAMQLVQLYLIDDRNNQFVTESDLCNTIEMLAKIQTHTRQAPEGLGNIIDILRQNHEVPFFGDRASIGPTFHIHSGILQVRAQSYEDPPGLVEKTDFLLRDWISIYNSQHHGRDSTKAFGMFVHQMNVHGILKTDDLITRFFRLSTQFCVETVYRILADKSNPNISLLKPKCYHTLDAFVRLVSLLVKHSGETNNTTTKIHLLNKILGIVAGCLLQDHDTRTIQFQQLPYQRIFTMLFLELNAPEPVLETINFHILTAYCHTLHILRPSKAAGFCYAWLELVSHRVFMGRMLATTPQQKCWPLYAQLLIDLFKYLAPFLRNAELAKPVTMLYKGTLRVLLVLLHDFPEFLCDYHYGFCDVIPPNCIQMRNLILSAFPRNMRLPDPFTPNLKVDMLPEISYGPRILTNISLLITPAQFKKDLDSYLKARAPVTFLSELRSNLQVSNEPGVRYNISLMNALVLYVGTQAIAYIRGKGHTPNMSTIAHSAHMDIFQNLAVDLDTEGRYLFLNAIANQLRYPNSHTHYFSCTLLYLFAEANTEAIQEQITRVLLERLIVNRPHPWGLLITFIELIKNPTYKFWHHEFVHCAPEIEKLFESVAKSCMVKMTVQQQETEIQE